jgi:hypothetical protein
MTSHPGIGCRVPDPQPGAARLLGWLVVVASVGVVGYLAVMLGLML